MFLIEYFKIYFEFLGDRKVFSVLLLSVKLLKLVLIIKVLDFDFWYGMNSIKKYMNINVFLFFFIFIEKYILVFWIKIGGMNFFIKDSILIRNKVDYRMFYKFIFYVMILDFYIIINGDFWFFYVSLFFIFNLIRLK